jgi:hypothetical protein
MNASKFLFPVALWLAWACLLADCATSATHETEPKELPLLQNWRGDYPVSQLNRLPEGQRTSRTGYLGDMEKFADVWQAFRPGENLPEVDFSKHLVVFFRNVDFYNRTAILKVILRDGVAEILAMETRSALPIEDKVAMSLAVIPRPGVKFIQVHNERIAVTANDCASASGPLNATYTIAGREIPLRNGRFEVPAAPGSATKVRTFIFGETVYGDLDRDGDEDAALLLVHDPGGSGTFFYVAAALNFDGQYRGTNAVFLGDRIAPQDVAIQNGLVVADYADRRPEDPMSTEPSVGQSMYLTLENGKLVVLRTFGEAEQVLEGWVTIGHEVRSFVPCSQNTDHWLLGSSPALSEIMAAYRQALPEARAYTPLFMILAGKFAEPPRDGFGADYEAAFLATALLGIRPKGNCRSEYIVVDSPAPGAPVTSPLTVRGRARGTWYFEGDFPIVLKDAHGSVIAGGFVTAKGPWMTEGFVPFEGTIEFKKPNSDGRGSLIFKKDNPTGLPKHDDAMEIPLFFK